MNPIKNLINQTAIYGLSSIIGRFLNFLLVPLYTRVFPKELYGEVSELYAYVAFIFIFLTYGMETSFFKFVEQRSDLRKIYSNALLLLLATTSLFLIGFLLFRKEISTLIQYENHTEYISWLTIIISCDILMAIPFAKLRLQDKAKRFAVLKLLNIAINISANCFFILLCPFLLENNPDSIVKLIYNPEIQIGYIFISNLIANFITLFLLLPDTVKLISFSYFSWQESRAMLIFGIPLILPALALLINQTLDKILLRHLIVVPDWIINPDDAEQYIKGEIGIYSANYKIGIFISLFIQTFRYAAEPFFFKQAENKKSKAIYADIMKYFVVFCLVVFLVIMMYIDIIKYFIDSSYHEGVKIVPILLIALIFSGIVYNLSIWYKLTGKTKYGAYISIIGAIITIVLNIIAIPLYGYMGSVWATFFSYFTMMIISFFLGKKHYKVNYDLKSITGYFALAVMFYYISKYVNFESFWVKYILNTIILMIFIVVVSIREKFIYSLVNYLKNRNNEN